MDFCNTQGARTGTLLKTLHSKLGVKLRKPTRTQLPIRLLFNMQEFVAELLAFGLGLGISGLGAVVKFSWTSDLCSPDAYLPKKANEHGVKNLANLVGAGRFAILHETMS